MSKGLLRALAALHVRGFHVAVLAGLLMMPAVASVGWIADDAARQRPDLGLRGSLDPAAPVAVGR